MRLEYVLPINPSGSTQRGQLDWMLSASEGKGMESCRRGYHPVATSLPPITNRPRQLGGEQRDKQAVPPSVSALHPLRFSQKLAFASHTHSIDSVA